MIEQRERSEVRSIETRVVPESYDPGTRTFEIRLSTGAAVRRYTWSGPYDEVLSLEAEHVRLARINTGRCPLVEVHNIYDNDSVIGSIVEGSVRLEGGDMIGSVRMHETERAVHLTERMRRGELCNLSLGYRTYSVQIVEDDEGPDVRTAIDWEPFECSLVPVGADDGSHSRSTPAQSDDANVCIVRTIRRGRTMPPEDPNNAPSQRNAEPTPAPAPSPAAEPAPAAAPAAAPPAARSEAPTPAGGPDPAQSDAIRAEERTRIHEIRRIGGRLSVDAELVTRLVNDGTSLDQARAAMIDAIAESDSEEVDSRTAVTLDERTKHGGAVTRALLHRFDPGAYPLNEGDDARGMLGETLLDLGVRHLERSGSRMPGHMVRDHRAMVVLGQGRSVGYHTTTDFPGVLGNVTGRVLRDAYKLRTRAFEPLVRNRSVSDFRPVTVQQLGGASQLDEVKEGAEYPLGTVMETGETYRILKYGKRIAVTREAILADDLNAFARVAQLFGQNAARKESALFFMILNDNPVMSDGQPLFSVAHQNIITDPLSMAGLASARKQIGLQTDIDGESELDLMMDYLVVPLELEVPALQLTRLVTNPTTPEQGNVFSGSLQTIAAPQLDRESATAWFAAASPSQIDTIERAYLQGQSEPAFFTREGFEIDGFEVKVRHEVGMCPIDHRGLIKSTGTGA